MTQSSRPDWDSLFARRTLGVRLGLEVVSRAFEALGRPAGTVPAIHIVGTNGKGSTAAMLTSGLAAVHQRGAGTLGRTLRSQTGVYTSPHLHRVSERVAIDGEPVSEAVLWRAVQAVDDAETRAPAQRALSFFEVLTLAAMLVFEEVGVKTLVVETGLGGRLDATRVVAPVVVAVTSIAADHQQWLGKDLTAIAGEKAGVFVPGVPVVSATQVPEVRDALSAAADRVGCPLTFVSSLAAAPPRLPGPHQRQNAGVALAALRVIHPHARAADLDDTRWPARLETIDWERGRVTLDAAHNPAACAAVVDALRVRSGPPMAPPPVDLIIVGAQPDKDVAAMLAALRRLAVPITEVDFEGAEVWRLVHREVSVGKHVLVCGSHRLVAAVRARCLAGSIGRHAVLAPPDPSDPRTAGG